MFKAIIKDEPDFNSDLWCTKGIIPAHAGKSSPSDFKLDFDGDHPRSCGEKCVSMTGVGCRTGSSPLMRGKGPCLGVTPSSIRIIPAHAGKRPPGDYAHSYPADHPRSCGEKQVYAVWRNYGLGSSPLMRGKDSVRCCAAHWPGIIPAHAGKRGDKLPRIGYCEDHPRSCGEK